MSLDSGDKDNMKDMEDMDPIDIVTWNPITDEYGNIVASSLGRNIEQIRPLGFTGYPYPPSGTVSVANLVRRINEYGPLSCHRCCSIKVCTISAIALVQCSLKIPESPVSFQ